MKNMLPNINLTIERWKWNKEFQLYVSNQGHFKDKNKNLLPIKVGNNGYCYILTGRGFKMAHRLVMLTWRPIPNAEDLTIDHLNHNKRNNSVKNLEWVTDKENKSRADQDLVNAIYKKELEKMQQQIKILEEKDIKHSDDFIIIGGNRKFGSFTAAAQWLIANKNMPKGATICAVKKNIMKAIKTNINYTGIRWTISFKI